MLAEASWIFPCCSNNNGSQLEYSPRQRTVHCLINDQTDKIIKMRVEFHVNVVMLKLSIFVGFRKDIFNINIILKLLLRFNFAVFSIQLTANRSMIVITKLVIHSKRVK